MKRYILGLAAFTLAFLPHAAFCDELKGPQNFRLTPTILSAIEGGPLVVRYTVAYSGHDSIRIAGGIGQPIVFVEGAGESTARFNDRRQTAWVLDDFQMDRHSTITSITAVHRSYRQIPSGKNKLTISWALYSPRKRVEGEPQRIRNPGPDDWTRAMEDLKRRTIVEFNETLDVNVLPATRENLLACAKKLHSMLDTAKSLEDLDTVLQHILYKPRIEFKSVAVRLLDNDLLHRYHYLIACGMFDSAATEREGVARLVEYAGKPNPRAVRDVFARLLFEIPKATVLSETTIAQLQSAPSIWPRIMVNILAPDRCNPFWRWHLMQELKLLKRPVPIEQLEGDLKELDSDSFMVRSRAKASIVKKGEMAIPTLRGLIEARVLSLEAENNVKSAMAAIEKLPVDRLEQQMMECLKGCLMHEQYGEYFRDNRAEHMKQIECVLQALSQNHPDAWISKEANRILAEYKQQKQK